MFDYNGFDEYGYVFYPEICFQENKKCKVHVHLHGCFNTAAIKGEDLIRNKDFLEHAASNEMIVIFPQNMYNLLTNPFSCWAIGPTLLPDENYYNQNGLQPKALKSVIDRVLAPKDSETYDYLSYNIASEDPVPLSQNFILATYYFLKNFWWNMYIAIIFMFLG